MIETSRQEGETHYDYITRICRETNDTPEAQQRLRMVGNSDFSREQWAEQVAKVKSIEVKKIAEEGSTLLEVVSRGYVVLGNRPENFWIACNNIFPTVEAAKRWIAKNNIIITSNIRSNYSIVELREVANDRR